MNDSTISIFDRIFKINLFLLFIIIKCVSRINDNYRQREDKELNIKTYLHKREKKNWNRNFENKECPKIHSRKHNFYN